MPVITWKRIAAGALFVVSIMLLAIGLLGRGDEFVVLGGAGLLLVVGLVVVAAYRRVGHNMRQVEDQQLALLIAQEKLDGISRKVLNVEEALQRAAVGELRPLILGAFRDVSGQIDRAAEGLTNRSSDLELRLRKLEASSVSVAASTSATGVMLDSQRALLGQVVGKLGAGHEVLGARIDTLEDDLAQRFGDLVRHSEKELSELWSTLEKDVVAPIKQLSREIGGSRLRFDILNDQLSMENVHRTFTPDVVAPVMTGWSLETASLARLLRLVLERKPKLIVECGCGASTVWLGYAARAVGAKVIALEHLAEYARAGREEIQRHGLEAFAEVRLATLEKFDIGGEMFSWYSRDAWQELAEIELLVVDGPPKATGHHARYPAVPLLQSGFAADTLVVLDDVHREEELEVLVRWREQFPWLDTGQSIGPRTVAAHWATAGKP